MRRALLTAAAAALASSPKHSLASSLQPPIAAKVQADLQRRAEEVRKDVAYPPAIIGEWQCVRDITGVDGDAGQAMFAWRALGGGGTFRKSERYTTRFVPIADVRRRASVVDRGFEYAARSGLAASEVAWSSEQPDVLRAGAYELIIEARDISPYEQAPPYAFGFAETVRVTERAERRTELFARLSRRLTPREDGALDATERVATFASLEAAKAAGSRPTSATTSRLRLTRRR